MSRSRHTDLVGSDTCAVEQAHVNTRFAPRHLNMMSDNLNMNVQINGSDFSEGGEAGMGRRRGGHWKRNRHIASGMYIRLEVGNIARW